MVRVVWEVKGVMNDNIKKATLVSVFQDHALTWYINHSDDHLTAVIIEIHNVLNREFSWSKLETKLIIEFKEIAMLPSETPWDLD